ncbi:hypothetical protein [Peterkaempfera bronchialis]|nr:hypothetical protein [Peterkaempfera bronchialis]
MPPAPAPALYLAERTGTGYSETTTALAGTTTAISDPFPLHIDPAALRL